MAEFTKTQGKYLRFIHNYTTRHGIPPAESEIAAAMCVSPPSVNQMVKSLEKKGLISRQPGQARSIRLLVSPQELDAEPTAKKQPRGTRRKDESLPEQTPRPREVPTRLYVLQIFLLGGPLTDEFDNKEISRMIEIRGDQTLAQLHEMIFEAYDRWEPRGYEFHLGRRPFDAEGPSYGIPSPRPADPKRLDARKTTIMEAKLPMNRAFGYLFDFDAQWYHHLQVERIEESIPTVQYPRVIKRVGKSPPQFTGEATEASRKTS